MVAPLNQTNEQMVAVVKTAHGSQNVQLRRVPVPKVSLGLAKLRVIATGICGTDGHIAHDEYGYEAPVIMGHEILGEVVEVGSPDDADWIGRRVACETYFSTCERCDWCRAGRRNLCPSRRSLGSYEDGGFASYVVLPVINLHALPEGLGELDGVLSEPLACVTQCLLDPPIINAGELVLVTGPGAMGQLAAQVAKSQGARVTLAGLNRDRERLEVAESLGMATTTTAVPHDTFDVVIECSGSAVGAATALGAARRGGRYVQVGILGRNVTLPIDAILYKELTLTSGFASTAISWRRAMALIENDDVTLGPLVTKRVSIQNFGDAFEAAASGVGLKTVILPDLES